MPRLSVTLVALMLCLWSESAAAFSRVVVMAQGAATVTLDGVRQNSISGRTVIHPVSAGRHTLAVLDASGENAVLGYSRWYSNNFGADPGNDVFEVEISDDGGASWTSLETVGPTGEGTTGGWYDVSFVVADIPGVTPSNQFRLRFTAEDAGSGSVIEAGVDAIVISAIACDVEPACPEDVAGSDGVVNVNDLLAIIANWSQSDPDYDIDGSGSVDVGDLLAIIAAWGDC